MNNDLVILGIESAKRTRPAIQNNIRPIATINIPLYKRPDRRCETNPAIIACTPDFSKNYNILAKVLITVNRADIIAIRDTTIGDEHKIAQ